MMYCLCRAHLDTESLPEAAHKLMVDVLGGEMLYVLTAIESHSGYSSRKKTVKFDGRERELKGSKISTEDDLAVEEFLKKVSGSGKAKSNPDQTKMKDVSILEEYYCRPSLSKCVH